MYYVLVATGHSHRDPGESASDPHEHTNVSKVYLRRNVGTRLASYFDHILMHVHGALPRGRRRRTDARRSSCTRTRAARIFMYESDKRVKKERKREKENSCRRYTTGRRSCGLNRSAFALSFFFLRFSAYRFPRSEKGGKNINRISFFVAGRPLRVRPAC